VALHRLRAVALRRRLRPLSTNPCIRFGHTIPVANHVDVVITQDAPGPNITHSESHVSPLCRAALRRCAACPLRRLSVAPLPAAPH
jgi:hypothetical protein